MATLTFNDYISGSNVSSIKKQYPSSQFIVNYDAGEDVTSWTFSADYQTIVVDNIAFDRAGEPNFTSAQVLGYFPAVTITGGDAPVVTDAANGLVKFTIPGDMYDGPINPNIRNIGVVTVVGFTVETDDGTKDTTRYARLQCWESGVDLGDPATHTGYVAL